MPPSRTASHLYRSSLGLTMRTDGRPRLGLPLRKAGKGFASGRALHRVLAVVIDPSECRGSRRAAGPLSIDPPFRDPELARHSSPTRCSFYHSPPQLPSGCPVPGDAATGTQAVRIHQGDVLEAVHGVVAMTVLLRRPRAAAVPTPTRAFLPGAIPSQLNTGSAPQQDSRSRISSLVRGPLPPSGVWTSTSVNSRPRERSTRG
jgi:hypothetical protein